jgi:hypothetical protein
MSSGIFELIGTKRIDGHENGEVLSLGWRLIPNNSINDVTVGSRDDAFCELRIMGDFFLAVLHAVHTLA